MGAADEPITLDEAPDASRWGVGARSEEAQGLDDHPSLVIAWSMRDPSRLGESCVFPEEQQARIIGRGRGEPSDGAARAEFIPRRPGFSGAAAPLDGATLSRRHVRVTRVGDALNVTNMGRSTMALDGEPVARCELVESCTLLLAQEMLFLCDRRPTDFGRVQKGQGDFDFGRADPQGLVGETAEFWALRDRIRFAAGTSAGVLVTGSAGSGRESVGRAIHKLSPSRQNPIVAIDGSSLRSDDLEGLLRREDHPTLLIDELSDVGFELQPTLARYAARIATRPPPRGQLLATTTKNADKIRPSLANRFPLTVRVPDLEERRADIPLIARDMLHHMAREQPEIGHRYFEGWDETEPGKGEPRLSPLLMIRLLVHEWAGNVRELSSVLWRIVLSSPSTFLDVTPDVEPLLGLPRGTEPGVLEPQAIRDALRHTNGKVAAAARHLGLKSRFQLYRLMEKYDIKG